MDIVLLVKAFLTLIILLALLIFFLFYIPKKKKRAQKTKSYTTQTEPSDYQTLQSLLEVIKNRQSTTEELAVALELIIKYHGTIHPKLGIRLHPDFNLYGEVLLRICRHPNTNKDIILKFDRELEQKNEEYKKDINDFLTKGLNSRGF